MILKTVIVDDEEVALKTIETILTDYCTNVNIIGRTTSPIEAIELIRTKKPQLVFTDIDMPEMDGFEMFESIPEKDFEIVFVTAINHFAIKAFKISAVDYILKPIHIPEVVNAVNRVENLYKADKGDFSKYITLFENLDSKIPEKIALPTSTGIELLLPEDIVYVEAVGSYAIFYLIGGRKIMVSKTIGEIEILINFDYFMRIHKASIINLNYIERYSLRKTGAGVELKNGVKLSVSRRKRLEFTYWIEYHIKKL